MLGVDRSQTGASTAPTALNPLSAEHPLQPLTVLTCLSQRWVVYAFASGSCYV
jgi:hypothetical protein